MRTSQEIEKERAEKISKVENSPQVSNIQELVIIELLYDIRDLLNGNK